MAQIGFELGGVVLCYAHVFVDQLAVGCDDVGRREHGTVIDGRQRMGEPVDREGVIFLLHILPGDIESVIDVDHHEHDSVGGDLLVEDERLEIG